MADLDLDTFEVRLVAEVDGAVELAEPGDTGSFWGLYRQARTPSGIVVSAHVEDYVTLLDALVAGAQKGWTLASIHSVGSIVEFT